MRTRRVILALATLVVVLSLAGTAAAQCNPDYVGVKANFITVVPSGGGDDTASLQCAFDLGAAMGPGVTVRLAAGTFYTEQLVIDGFRGLITGMGLGTTIVRNAAHPLPIDKSCYVGDECFADAPPSPTNRYPSLVTLLAGDFRVLDLSLVVTGGHGTEPWAMWGMKLMVFSNVLEMMGSDSSYRLERVEVNAGNYHWDGDFQGYAGDAAGGALLWSFTAASRRSADPPLVTNSTLLLSDSVLRGMGVRASDLVGSRVMVRHSSFQLNEPESGMIVGDNSETPVLVEGNVFAGLGPRTKGVMMFRGNRGTGISGSSLWFGNNVFSGVTTGFQVAAGTFNDVKCEAVNNDFYGVPMPYALNGNPCKVLADK